MGQRGGLGEGLVEVGLDSYGASSSSSIICTSNKEVVLTRTGQVASKRGGHC